MLSPRKKGEPGLQNGENEKHMIIDIYQQTVDTFH